MNKQQFLSELSQYLSFFTAEERADIMAEYTARFDEAGPQGEAALLLELGTPMMNAIALKRKKEAGLPLTEKSAVPAAADEKPDEEAQAVEAEEFSEQEPETAESPDAEDINGDGEPSEAESEEYNEPAGSKAEKPRIKAGAVVSCVFLSIITVIAALAVMAVGAYFVIVMGNLLVVALQNLNLLTDVLMLFAGGLVSGGLGIVIFWLGLWAAIRIISRLVAKTRA